MRLDRTGVMRGVGGGGGWRDEQSCVGHPHLSR